MQRELIVAIVGAVVAIVFDVVISPNIALFSATPNAMVAYAIVIAMLYRGDAVYVIAFVMGLLSDLLGFGPVGALPFLLVLAAFCITRAAGMFDNGTLFVPLVTLALFIVLIELLHAGFMLAFGVGISVIDAIVYLALPCAAFDVVLGLVLYPVMSHFLVERRQGLGTEPPTARLR